MNAILWKNDLHRIHNEFNKDIRRLPFIVFIDAILYLLNIKSAAVLTCPVSANRHALNEAFLQAEQKRTGYLLPHRRISR